MFLIGEFSKITKVSVRMLRYYDQNNIFKPKETDRFSGYRYYTSEQIDDLYKIISLRDAGFTTAEIAYFIKENNEETIKNKIDKKRAELYQELEDIKYKLSQLDTISVEKEASEGSIPDISIILKEIPTYEVLSLRKTVKSYYDEGSIWQEMTEKLAGSAFDEKSEAFSLYHDEDDREEDVDIEVCVVDTKALFPLPDGIIRRQIEGHQHAASIIIHGSYRNISIAWKKFALWLEKNNNYKMNGPTRQICHVGAWNTDDENKYITELLVPLIMK